MRDSKLYQTSSKKMKTTTVLETMYADAFDHGECITIYLGKNERCIGVVDVCGRGKNRRVSSLTVDQEFRCKGYATKLMNKVIERHGHTNLHLIAMPTPGKDNPTLLSLVRFYKQCGFKLTDDREFVRLKSVGMKRPANES